MDDDKREMYKKMRFTMEYERDGDRWSYTVDMAPGRKLTFTFVEDEEFDSTTLDGRPIIVRDSTLLRSGRWL